MKSLDQDLKKKDVILFSLGVIGVLIMAIPYVILREGSIFNYHDELDGELLTYILGAKHLFDGNIYPEFMGGMDKTALTPPAPGAVLLFCVLPPMAALVAMQLIGSLIGYIGMYGCVFRLTDNRIAAIFTGLCYAYLPFLPVYGLSQYGLPLLLYVCLLLKDGAGGYKKVLSYLYVLVYALNSSLVLVGYAVLAFVCIWGIVDLMRKRNGRPLLAAAVLMLTVYLLINYRLLGEILLGNAAWVSHKTEYTYGIGSFFPYFLESFLYNREHSGDDHVIWLLLIAFGCLCTFTSGRKGGEKKENSVRDRRIITGCILFALFASVFTALWCSPFVVSIRNTMGALGSFQANRIMWMVPCAWYIGLGAAIGEIWTAAKGKKALILRGVLVLYAVAGGALILYHSEVKPNVMKLVKSDYHTITYADYYGIGVMNQAIEYLASIGDGDLSKFRVASLGIDPVASLYHGFYTLDGYSNNYSLDYKHAFRRIIAPELDRSEYLTQYFDEWGNRCYLFSAEIPGYYTVEKHGFFFSDYQFDKQAFEEMGGKYILSAAYILNAEEIGLELLNVDHPFETEESYYYIYIYRIKEDV